MLISSATTAIEVSSQLVSMPKMRVIGYAPLCWSAFSSLVMGTQSRPLRARRRSRLSESSALMTRLFIPRLRCLRDWQIFFKDCPPFQELHSTLELQVFLWRGRSSCLAFGVRGLTLRLVFRLLSLLFLFIQGVGQ